MSAPRRLAAVALLLSAALLGAAAYRALTPPMPDVDPYSVSLTDLDGQTRTLREWQGKLLLVNFWASWCSPCRREMPMLAALREQYREQGLEILGPAMDQPEAARRAAEQLGVNYPVFAGDVDIVRAMSALGDQLGALPYSVLIGRDGRVIARHSGELQREQLQRWIDAHL